MNDMTSGRKRVPLLVGLVPATPLVWMPVTHQPPHRPGVTEL
jgi:hypothetical protein